MARYLRACRAQRRVCIINCIWIFDCLRAWRLLPEGDGMQRQCTHLSKKALALLVDLTCAFFREQRDPAATFEQRGLDLCD